MRSPRIVISLLSIAVASLAFAPATAPASPKKGAAAARTKLAANAKGRATKAWLMAVKIGLKPAGGDKTSYSWESFHEQVTKLPEAKRPTKAWLEAQQKGLRPAVGAWKTYSWNDFKTDEQAQVLHALVEE